MTILAAADRLLEWLFMPAEKREHPSTIGEIWLHSAGLLSSGVSGVDVNEQIAMTYTAVWACVRILAESVASLPLIVYRRLPDGGKERAVNHPLYTLLHDLPNAENTSVEIREMLQAHLALWGNAYCEKEFDRAGRLIALWPLRPDLVTVKRESGVLVYDVHLPSGGTQRLMAERVMHIRGLTHDGMVGYSPIRQAREAIALGLATQQFGSAFFGNGARPGGVLEYPGVLSDKARTNLLESWDAMYKGVNNAQRVAILEEGMKYSAIGIPPEDAQFLETRKFQVTEIARIFRIPPHMLADLDRATFSNIEHQSLEFVVHTLRPWLVRWEQAINRDLFRPDERGIYFAEHLIDGLLRGDIQSRYQAYAIGRQQGFLSANDIRALENMNPVEHGDIYLVPLNMVPASQVGMSPTLEAEPAQERACECGHEHRTVAAQETRARARQIALGRQRLARAYQRMFEDVGRRVFNREIADVRRQIKAQKRNAHQFALWLNDFYLEHQEFWKRQILPLLLTYADQIGVDVANELEREPITSNEVRDFIDDYVATLARTESNSSFNQLRALLENALEANEDPYEAVGKRLDEWEATRAEKFAVHESRNSMYAIVGAMYAISQVVRTMWVANGDSCPFCLALDGKTISLDEVFLEAGVDFQPEGADTPLNVRSNRSHPPIHNGCDCGIVAVVER